MMSLGLGIFPASLILSYTLTTSQGCHIGLSWEQDARLPMATAIGSLTCLLPIDLLGQVRGANALNEYHLSCGWHWFNIDVSCAGQGNLFYILFYIWMVRRWISLCTTFHMITSKCTHIDGRKVIFLKIIGFRFKFHWSCSRRFNWNKVSIGFHNGLAQGRRQVMICINHGIVYWCIGLNDLTPSLFELYTHLDCQFWKPWNWTILWVC